MRKLKGFFLILFLVGLVPISYGQGTTQIEIMSARSLKAGRTRNHQKLVGNVVLRQGNTIMKCDSAEINQSNNDFMAWGHVSMP